MLHVLLVEDNAGEVLLVREAIRAASIAATVVIASDGEQAERQLKDRRFSLVVLDLSIPKIDGFEILQRYREISGATANSGTPIVIFTSSSNSQDRRRALALGARDYVVKPTTWQEFVTAVRSMFAHASNETDYPPASATV